MRGEGWGEGLYPRIRLSESPPSPASGRGEKREQPANYKKTRPTKPDAFFSFEPSNWSASVLEFKRDVELGAVGFNLAFGIKLKVELDDFGDAKIS